MLIAFHTVTFALRLAIANFCILYAVGFCHELACSSGIKRMYLIQDWTIATRERVRTGRTLERARDCSCCTWESVSSLVLLLASSWPRTPRCTLCPFPPSPTSLTVGHVSTFARAFCLCWLNPVKRLLVFGLTAHEHRPGLQHFIFIFFITLSCVAEQRSKQRSAWKCRDFKGVFNTVI